MSSVFVSYVREDAALVNRLADHLATLGIHVWLDRTSIPIGANYREAIAQAIRQGAFFIACFSRAFSERDTTYMFEEINVAIEELRQRPPAKPWFLSIRLDECVIPEIRINSTSTIRDLQWVDLFGNWDASVKTLVKAISPFGSTDCIREALKLFGVNDYASARAMLNNIHAAGVDLPPRVEYLLHYNLACAESRLAAEQSPNSKEQNSLLDSAANHLWKWMAFGAQRAWSALDRTGEDQIHAMAHDDDLLYVLSARRTRILSAIEQYLGRKITLPDTPTGRSGGGCVVLGTTVATRLGPLPIERVRIGDEILSFSSDAPGSTAVDTRVKAIHFGRSARCIRINGCLLATPAHRVLVNRERWTALADLEVGDQLMSDPASVAPRVETIEVQDGYFETFALTTDHPTHNYWTSSYLSHNMKD